jgi:short-subunit dehydrogenase
LLTMLGDASYGVSKAAALSFCEHVAISHSDVVQVHCLCPQAVDTALVSSVDPSKNAALTDGLLSPEQVAQDTLLGIRNGDFFIFPHPKVPSYVLRKAQDHARWIKGMQRMRTKLVKNKPNKLRSKL